MASKTKNSASDELLSTAEELISTVSTGDSDDLNVFGSIALTEVIALANNKKIAEDYPQLDAYHDVDLLDDRIVSMSKILLRLIEQEVIEAEQVEGLINKTAVPFMASIIANKEADEAIKTLLTEKKSKAEQARKIHADEQARAARLNAEATKLVESAANAGTKVSMSEAQQFVGQPENNGLSNEQTLQRLAESATIKSLITQFRACNRLDKGGSFDFKNTKNISVIDLKSAFMLTLQASSNEGKLSDPSESKMDKLVARTYAALRDAEKVDFEAFVNGLVAEYITADILKDLKRKDKIDSFEPSYSEEDANEGTDFFVTLKNNEDVNSRVAEEGREIVIRVDAKSAGVFANEHSLGKERGRSAEYFDIKKNRQGKPVLIFCPDRSKQKPILEYHRDFDRARLARFDSYSSNKEYRHLLRSTGNLLINYIKDHQNLLAIVC